LEGKLKMKRLIVIAAWLLSSFAAQAMPLEMQQLVDFAGRGTDPIAGREYLPAPSTPVASCTWSLVTTFGGSQRSQVWGMAKHNGVMHYGIGGDSDGQAMIYRGQNGSWMHVTPFNVPTMRVPTMLSASDGYLYAGTASQTDASQLWRSADGISYTMFLNFGTGVQSIQSLVEYGGHLYLTVRRKAQGAPSEVWSSSNGWAAPIKTFAATFAYKMVVHGSDLYVGTGYPAEVHKFDGTTWTQISNFNNSDLLIVESLVSYRGDLVIAFGKNWWVTPSPPSVMSYNATNGWAQVGATQPGEWRIAHNHNDAIVVNDTLIVSAGSAYAGVSLWSLADGKNWTKLGGRPAAFGADITGTSFAREWIYKLVWNAPDLYVSFATTQLSPIQPAVHKCTP
jgi:hypothetical protein